MKVFIKAKILQQWIQQVFLRLGANKRASRTAAAALYYADVNGVDTHGVVNLERIYVHKCEQGQINVCVEPTIAVNLGAVAVVDGRAGLGMVAGRRAMRLAMKKAKRYGVGAVAVRNSTHFGAAGYYSCLALKGGMVGMAMTNLGGQGIAPPPGGVVPMLGTNPISVAAPAAEVPAFVLDMSTTAASTGKVRDAARRGLTVPPGWLADATGHPVLDPSDYERGTAYLQFAGGYKGFNLAVLVDVLCGVLAGAAVGPNRSPTNRTDQDVGHFLLALDPQAFGATAFCERMDEMLLSLLSCPTVTPEVSIRYAGHIESLVHSERLMRGIPLDKTLVESLNQLAGRLSLPALQPLCLSKESTP